MRGTSGTAGEEAFGLRPVAQMCNEKHCSPEQSPQPRAQWGYARPMSKFTSGRRPIKSGGPGFIGAKGSSKTVMAGSKRGGRKLTKTSKGKQFGSFARGRKR